MALSVWFLWSSTSENHWEAHSGFAPGRCESAFSPLFPTGDQQPWGRGQSWSWVREEDSGLDWHVQAPLATAWPSGPLNILHPVNFTMGKVGRGLFYNSAQFWHCLWGDSIRRQCLQAQLCTHRCQFQVQVPGYPQLLSDLALNLRFPCMFTVCDKKIR